MTRCFLRLFNLYPLLALVAATHSAAQTVSPTQSEPTVVTVTGQATPISNTSASVEVVTRKDIDTSHVETFPDLLRQTPFLFVAQPGSRGSLTTVTLRGGKPNFTLVLYDGIPLNDITNTLGGSYDFSTLSTDQIEKVEIVRGPLSSLYGSDAVAGVINIIPRRGSGKTEFQISAEGGNFATRTVNASVAGSVGHLDYALGGSYWGMGEQVEKDPFSLTTATLNTHYTLTPAILLHFLLRYHNSNASGFPTGGGGPEYSLLRTPQTNNADELITGLGWKQQASRIWLYSFDFDNLQNNGELNVPAILDRIPPGFRSVPAEVANTQFKRTRLNFWNAFRLGSNLTADFGAAWRYERGISDGSLGGALPDSFRITRQTESANGQLVYGTHRLTLTAGLRMDKGGAYQPVFSPRLGASFRLNEHGTRLRASWGRGFKLPSFYALADRVVGNPSLKPERSNSFDAGIEDSFLRGHLRPGVTVFWNSDTNLVDFSAQLFRLVNRSEVQIKGTEFSLVLPVKPRLEFGAYASYLHWQVQNSTEPFRNVPHWQTNARVRWQATSRCNLNLNTLWVGRRYDYQVPVPAQEAVGGFSRTDLALGYTISESFSVFARVDNLFNAQYHEYIGFPNPGVYGRVGVNFRFR